MITIISSHITTVIPHLEIIYVLISVFHLAAFHNSSSLVSQAWPLEVRAARQALLRPSLSAGWSLTEHAALTRQFLGRVGGVRIKGVGALVLEQERIDPGNKRLKRWMMWVELYHQTDSFERISIFCLLIFIQKKDKMCLMSWIMDGCFFYVEIL